MFLLAIPFLHTVVSSPRVACLLDLGTVIYSGQLMKKVNGSLLVEMVVFLTKILCLSCPNHNKKEDMSSRVETFLSNNKLLNNL